MLEHSMNQSAVAGDPPLIPPNSEAAEQALLAAILYDNRALDLIERDLRPEHFFHEVHQRIFAAILAQVDAGRKADAITLKKYVDTPGGLDQFGGVDYLGALAGAVVSVKSADDYAQLIRDSFLRRRLVDIGAVLQDEAVRVDLDTTAEDVIEEAETALYHLTEAGAASPVKTVAEISRESLREIEEAMSSEGRLIGAPTGVSSLDRAIKGLIPGKLYIVAGRPGMGKSALAGVTFAQSVARTDLRVALFSAEMSETECFRRLVAAWTGISATRQQEGALSALEWARVIKAHETIQDWGIEIVYRPGMTVAAIRSEARRLKRRHGLGLVIVDYLQIMRLDVGVAARETEVTRLGQAAQSFKDMAGDLGVAVVLVSQLNRQVEARDDKRPSMADLHGSGGIEAAADVVILLYREEYYLQLREPQSREGESATAYNERFEKWKAQMDGCRGQASLIIGKNRQGRSCLVQAAFHGDRTTFADIEGGIHAT